MFSGESCRSWHWMRVVQSLSCVELFAIPWTIACQASLSSTISWSLLRLTSIESVMPSNHLTLCHLHLLLPAIFTRIRVFSNELTLCIRWPKYWHFSLSMSPSNEYTGLIFLSISSCVWNRPLTFHMTSCFWCLLSVCTPKATWHICSVRTISRIFIDLNSTSPFVGIIEPSIKYEFISWTKKSISAFPSKWGFSLWKSMETEWFWRACLRCTNRITSHFFHLLCWKQKTLGGAYTPVGGWAWELKNIDISQGLMS